MTYKSLTSLFLITCAVVLNTPPAAVAAELRSEDAVKAGAQLINLTTPLSDISAHHDTPNTLVDNAARYRKAW